MTSRTASFKILRDKAFDIVENPKYRGYQGGLCFNGLDSNLKKKKKKKKACGSGTEKEDISNKELAEELHKTVIRKFQKWKVPSPFIDNIWDADLAEMQRISKCDIGISFLLCFTDIFSKYAWVIPLKNKNALQLRMLPKKY